MYNVNSTIFLTEIGLENQAFKKRTQNKNIAKRSILNFLMCFQCFRIPFILCLGAVSFKSKPTNFYHLIAYESITITPQKIRGGVLYKERKNKIKVL